MKKKSFLICIIGLILIVVGLGIGLFITNKELKNSQTIYCVMEDNAQQTKMEMYFDFKKKQVYRYTIISTNPYNDNINIDNYKSFMDNSNKKYKGATSKVWYDNENVMTTEIYDLGLLSEKEFKEITGMSKKELQTKSRDEIIESIIPMGDSSSSSFKCE